MVCFSECLQGSVSKQEIWKNCIINKELHQLWVPFLNNFATDRTAFKSVEISYRREVPV